MSKFDIISFAARTANEQDLGGMQPVIEKEVIHYEILDSLDRQGILSQLHFQGGTCLRLCYDGIRYSEDLDFAAGENFNKIDMDSLAAVLKHDLETRFEVAVHASAVTKEKSFGKNNVGLKRRWIVVDTAPERPDLPSQRVKIEIASVPSHTREVRPLALHYQGLPQSYSTTIIVCQTATEILADKIISFADSADYVRYRDLWDIPWLIQRPNVDTSQIAELVSLKHEDYYCEQRLKELLENGAAKADEKIHSDEFAQEMRRFIPHSTIARTLDRPDYIEVMARAIQDAYALAMHGI